MGKLLRLITKVIMVNQYDIDSPLRVTPAIARKSSKFECELLKSILKPRIVTLSKITVTLSRINIMAIGENFLTW